MPETVTCDASRPAQWQATCFLYLDIPSSLIIEQAVIIEIVTTTNQWLQTYNLLPGMGP